MERSLHKSLKAIYCDGQSRTEVKLGRFRIDAIAWGELIEVQVGSLFAIRKKVETLIADHPLRVVKPLIVERMILRSEIVGGPVLSRRKSPQRATWGDAFLDLSAFAGFFPHPNLSIEFLWIAVEEWRGPAPDRSLKRSRRPRDRARDIFLKELRQSVEIRRSEDLKALFVKPLSEPFGSREVAESLGISREEGRKAVYGLKRLGLAVEAGKQGNAKLYGWRG